MKFSCEKNLLSEAISKVIKVIPSKATIQAIEGILFHLYDDGILKLTGFDFIVGIETSISVQDCEPGSIIINAKLFLKITYKFMILVNFLSQIVLKFLPIIN